MIDYNWHICKWFAEGISEQLGNRSTNDEFSWKFPYSIYFRMKKKYITQATLGIISLIMLCKPRKANVWVSTLLGFLVFCWTNPVARTAKDSQSSKGRNRHVTWQTILVNISEVIFVVVSLRLPSIKNIKLHRSVNQKKWNIKLLKMYVLLKISRIFCLRLVLLDYQQLRFMAEIYRVCKTWQNRLIASLFVVAEASHQN